jgi:hypothetical protein
MMTRQVKRNSDTPQFAVFDYFCEIGVESPLENCALQNLDFKELTGKYSN